MDIRQRIGMNTGASIMKDKNIKYVDEEVRS